MFFAKCKNGLATESVAKDLTPCEFQFGKRPDFSCLRVFGFNEYVHVSIKHQIVKFGQCVEYKILVG